MKFASIYLSNYIGIYNGMGLYEIHIDMTKCKNRITVIRGINGSGKSTLVKAMNLFPDPNDAFIPGMPARKEIVLADNNVLYKLIFKRENANVMFVLLIGMICGTLFSSISSFMQMVIFNC